MRYDDYEKLDKAYPVEDRKFNTELVHNPSHYQLPNGLQVIDVIKSLLTPEEYRGYLKGNILKYSLRADKKGEELTDRGKQAKYLEWLINELG